MTMNCWEGETIVPQFCIGNVWLAAKVSRNLGWARYLQNAAAHDDPADNLGDRWSMSKSESAPGHAPLAFTGLPALKGTRLSSYTVSLAYDILDWRGS